MTGYMNRATSFTVIMEDHSRDIKELFMKRVQSAFYGKISNKLANTTNNDLLNFIDLAPTMLSIAKLKILQYIQVILL